MEICAGVVMCRYEVPYVPAFIRVVKSKYIHMWVNYQGEVILRRRSEKAKAGASLRNQNACHRYEPVTPHIDPVYPSPGQLSRSFSQTTNGGHEQIDASPWFSPISSLFPEISMYVRL